MKKKGSALGSLILLTLVSIGPIGWFFIDLFEKRYDRLVFLFVVSLALAVICAVFWTLFFSKTSADGDRENEAEDDGADELKNE